MQIKVEVVETIISLARKAEKVDKPDPMNGRRLKLQDLAFTPEERQLYDYIAGLNEQEVAELEAVMWIGRGDSSPEDWEFLVAHALSIPNNKLNRVYYLIEKAPLAEYLQDGLEKVQAKPLGQ